MQNLFNKNIEISHWIAKKYYYRVIANEWTPFHTGFELFLIVLGKSDENMPYWLGLGDSFAMLYIAVTCLVQELY